MKLWNQSPPTATTAYTTCYRCRGTGNYVTADKTTSYHESEQNTLNAHILIIEIDAFSNVCNFEIDIVVLPLFLLLLIILNLQVLCKFVLLT